MAILRKFDISEKIDIVKTSRWEFFTVNSVHEELWLALGNITEVRKIGLNVFKKKRGLAGEKLNSAYDKFCAFCYQAKNYYDSALHAPWDSSPLLYYYSFMNLAKAIILLHRDLPDNPIHGLSFDTKNASLNIKRHKLNLISDYNKCIFPVLYEIVFGHRPIVNTFNIVRLFSYISQIFSQERKIGIEQFNIRNGFAILVGDSLRGLAWIILLSEGDIDLTREFPFSSGFRNLFEIVDKNPLVLHQLVSVFGISILRLATLNIYQSVTPKPIDSKLSLFCSDIFTSAKGVITEKVYPEPGDFKYNLPYQQGSDRKLVYMNEFLALYLLMFYLSSLVRYRPDILIKLESKKEKWLFKSFVLSAPIMLLRYCVNILVGESIIIKKEE